LRFLPFFRNWFLSRAGSKINENKNNLQFNFSFNICKIIELGE
jgi:hypothetical protein